MQSMRIVLPGALPDPAVSAELLKHLPEASPRLVKWLENSRAKTLQADPAQHFCTPLEFLQLQQHGFEITAQTPASTGMGPWLAGSAISDDDPVWLVELVHLAAAREGALLQPARKLGLHEAESRALFNTAAELFQDTDFGIEFITPSHWRVHPPATYAPVCASPELVSLGNVTDWWSQDPGGRAWRRLANEVQMAWFNHPVNQQRAEKGLIPVNGVWLFGGARRSQLTSPITVAAQHIHDCLQPFTQTADWGGWLAALADLDQNVLSKFDGKPQPELTLTGHDRILTYLPNKPIWKRLLPGSRNIWKQWWINPQ